MVIDEDCFNEAIDGSIVHEPHAVDWAECSAGQSGSDRWTVVGLGRAAARHHNHDGSRNCRLSGLVQSYYQRCLGLGDIVAGRGELGMACVDDDSSANGVSRADRAADGIDPDGGLIRSLLISVLADLLLWSL